MSKKQEKLFDMAEQCTALLNLSIRAKEFTGYMEYFYMGKSLEESKFYVNSDHLKFIAFTFLKSSIIELAKMYSQRNNDHFRLIKFINNFENDWKGASQELKNLDKRRQFLVDHEELINRLIAARDMIHAHTDKDIPKFEDVNISFYEFIMLADFALDFVADIFKSVIKSPDLLKNYQFTFESLNVIEAMQNLGKQ